jgi:hypothetical protein
LSQEHLIHNNQHSHTDGMLNSTAKDASICVEMFIIKSISLTPTPLEYYLDMQGVHLNNPLSIAIKVH